ncbi:MAG: methyltransferase [Nitrospinaceae bacterium]
MLTYRQILDKIDQLEEAKTLSAALELGIFSILKKDALSARVIARRAGTQPLETEMFLDVLVAMGALFKRGGRYRNTPETFKHFCASSPHYKKGMVMLRGEDRKEWSRLVESIKNGRDLSEYEGGDDPEFRRLFTYAMHERSEFYSEKVAGIVTRRPVGRLLDLGSGPGSYSAVILRKDKKATATLLDRPAALKVAREIHQNHFVAQRLSFKQGDLFETDFGRDFDTVFYSNILHIYNPAENKKLFRKIHRCLVPGGRCILVDLFLKENRKEPYEAAMFAMTMLLYTATGRTYTFKETESLLRAAGFSSFRRFPLEEGSSLLEAVKR